MQETELRSWLRNELFERVPNNIAIIDREFRIVEANGKYTETFGPWRDKLCHQVYKGSDEPCASCKVQMVFEDGEARVIEEQRLNRFGRYSYYVVHFEPIVHESGRIPYVIEMSRDVTEHRMLQREHDIMFDRVPCYIVVLDRELTIVRNNELFRKTFGESLGKKCYEVFQQRSDLCQDCPARKSFHDRQVHSAHKTGLGKNGQTIHYHVTTAPLGRGETELTHVIELALDTTDVRALEQRLKESFDFQQSLINSSIDSIIAADTENQITIFNPSAQSLFNYDAEEVLGQCIFDQFVPKEFLDTIQQDGSTCLLDETRLQDREQNDLPVRFSGVVLKSDDRYLGNAAFLQDLRKIKQLEQEKVDAERLAAVGETVAGLAHGIKNVLMGLEGGMYVVNSGMRKDNKELTRRGWEMLQGNIQRITEYVRDFLSFAKGRTPEVKRIDPNKPARDVVELYKGVAAQSGIKLSVDFQEGLSDANMDEEGIHTCLTNLVSNAIDACEMSDKKQCCVNIRTYERDGVLTYEVSDNGCGMDYEVKKKVFTTFFSTKELSKGTGLGLLVTRRITQEHGGKVTLESTEGEGTVFRLNFPRDRLPELTDQSSQNSDSQKA